MPFKAWFFQCHQRHSLALIFSSLILLAMITACSFTYVYPRIDAFALWKIDDYITLNGRQEDWLELRLQQALRWHHTEQLPRWQDWLIVFRADIANGKMNPKRYSSHVVELRALLNDTSSGLIDDATNLIKTLSNEQIDELEQELQKNLDDYEERNLERSKEEHQARLSEKTSDNLVDWFGNLNNDQKALVRNYAENLPDGRVLAITARQRWLLHLKQVLAMRAQQDSLVQALQTMVLHPEKLRSNQYQQWIELRRRQYRQLLADVFQLASEAQQKHILSELDDWIDDIEDLIAREI